MSEISFVPFEEINSPQRWDAEYFRPYFRDLGNRLLSICDNKVSDFAKPSVESFDSTKVNKFNYVEISQVDLSVGTVGFSEINSSETPDRAQFLMAGGEILVSTVRPNRSAIGLLPATYSNYVASSGFLPLMANSKKWRSYLFTWFKLQSITDWLDRCSKASMYPAVTPIDILNTPVFYPSDRMLEDIHKLISEMEKIVLRGQYLYPEAQQELLERMSWESINKRKAELHFVQDTDEIHKAGRLDAEHFQPQYKRICDHLLKQNSVRLKTLCVEIAKGTQPSGYMDNGEITVVKSKNVFGTGIDFEGCEHTTIDAYSDLSAHLGNGDVVVTSTGFGTLGRAAVIPSHNYKLVAAVDLLILRLHKDILPEYLVLFLNSPAGRAQSEMFQTGSSGQLHLYPQHLEEILVFMPRNRDGSIDIAWQKKMAEKVSGSGRAKQDALAKLEEAKKLIEKSISV